MIFEDKILALYRGMACSRFDDTGLSYYFSAKDFEGLLDESFDFPSSLGHTLRGHLYSYGSPKEGRIVVFEHGLGGGHLSYMKEIELLCRHGYLVFAYDHTGCMASGGENTVGLAQSLADLNDCLTALKNSERFRDADISVVGHSWGGFSTLNIPKLHKVSHIVAIAGFVSVGEIVNSFLRGILRPYRRAVMALENSSNPRFSRFSATESLKNTETKALLIYSSNDGMVRPVHYKILKKALGDNKNIKFLYEKNKGHNPNYTVRAVKYLMQCMKDMTKGMREGRLKTAEARASFVASYDWNKMTEQDMTVWEEIFACLDS